MSQTLTITPSLMKKLLLNTLIHNPDISLNKITIRKGNVSGFICHLNKSLKKSSFDTRERSMNAKEIEEYNEYVKKGLRCDRDFAVKALEGIDAIYIFNGQKMVCEDDFGGVKKKFDVMEFNTGEIKCAFGIDELESPDALYHVVETLRVGLMVAWYNIVLAKRDYYRKKAGPIKKWHPMKSRAIKNLKDEKYPEVCKIADFLELLDIMHHYKKQKLLTIKKDSDLSVEDESFNYAGRAYYQMVNEEHYMLLVHEYFQAFLHEDPRGFLEKVLNEYLPWFVERIKGVYCLQFLKGYLESFDKEKHADLWKAIEEKEEFVNVNWKFLFELDFYGSRKPGLKLRKRPVHVFK